MSTEPLSVVSSVSEETPAETLPVVVAPEAESAEPAPSEEGFNLEALLQDLQTLAITQAASPPALCGLTAEETAEIRVTEAEGGSSATAIALKGVKAWEDIPSLTSEVRRGILEKGWVKPSRIQETALPLIITERRNIIAQAQNGSGKTATFALGLVSAVDPSIQQTQGIVLSPTRELARQNLAVIEQLCKYNGITTKLVVPDEKGLPDGRASSYPQIMSATPGKMENLLKKRCFPANHVKMFVLDEADVMISTENNMGGTVATIRSMLPKECQVLLFSATYSDQVRNFATRIVPKALKIEVSKEDLTLETIWQTYVDCGEDGDKKFAILSDLYAIMNIGQSVIFVNSRSVAFDIAKKLKAEGHAVSLICGTQNSGPEKMDTRMRDTVLQQFRDGVTKVLIATDVLARGIDVPAVTLVINYELPMEKGRPNMETYLHRIGRTGRFGQKGIAINMVSSRDVGRIRQIEDFYRNKIEKIDADVETLEKRMQQIHDNRALYK